MKTRLVLFITKLRTQLHITAWLIIVFYGIMSNKQPQPYSLYPLKDSSESDTEGTSSKAGELFNRSRRKATPT